jgi:hypothetical protein
MKDKVSEFGSVRGILVIYLVASSRGCPRGTIPNGGIEGHGLRGEVGPTEWHPFDFPYGDIINIKSVIIEKNVSAFFTMTATCCVAINFVILSSVQFLRCT